MVKKTNKSTSNKKATASKSTASRSTTAKTAAGRTSKTVSKSKTGKNSKPAGRRSELANDMLISRGQSARGRVATNQVTQRNRTSRS